MVGYVRWRYTEFELALRLVSQCCSSSGCERNWSTFALIHTKVRNRLSYQKLHKLVYVNYNLRIRMRQAGLYHPPEEDPFDRLNEMSIYDESNPIREWMEHGRSNAVPLLDEEDTESDTPLPNRMVVEGDNPRQIERITGSSSLAEWAHKHVGDTHIGKRKQKRPIKKGTTKKKKFVEQVVQSDASTESDIGRQSPTYQESADSSSASSDGDDDGDGDGDGDDDAPHGGSSAPVDILHFTGETEFTHATQDRDHGAPESQRTTIPVDRRGKGRRHHHGSYASQDTESSFSSSSEVPPPIYPGHIAPHPSNLPPVQWVYEWQNPDWYNMLVTQWRATGYWTGQSWFEYKAMLLARDRIAIMSTEEYNMSHYSLT